MASNDAVKRLSAITDAVDTCNRNSKQSNIKHCKVHEYDYATDAWLDAVYAAALHFAQVGEALLPARQHDLDGRNFIPFLLQEGSYMSCCCFVAFQSSSLP